MPGKMLLHRKDWGWGRGEHIRFGKNSSLAGNFGLWVTKTVNFVDDMNDHNG